MINDSDIKRVTDHFDKKLDARCLLASHILVGEIDGVTPVRTGNLKGHNKYKKIAPLFYRILNNCDYVLDVIFGTAPHIIKPVTKKALYWKGSKHPVKSVHHPGTVPNNFFRHGLSAAIPKIRTTLGLQ